MAHRLGSFEQKEKIEHLARKTNTDQTSRTVDSRRTFAFLEYSVHHKVHKSLSIEVGIAH